MHSKFICQPSFQFSLQRNRSVILIPFLTSLILRSLVSFCLTVQFCVSSVDPSAFLAVVEAGASMVEIGNYDSFYDEGIVFSPEQILNLTVETRRILPLVTLSVNVPHTLSLPDQTKLAELLEQQGADVIQTEGGKCSNPSKPGALGLIEKVEIGNYDSFYDEGVVFSPQQVL